MMEETRAVYLKTIFTKQDFRNPLTNQETDERLRYRCCKKTQEVKTRPGQDASRQYQEMDFETHFDYNHDHDQYSSKVMPDTNRYYECTSNTEIEIGSVRPIKKVHKIYVKECDVFTREVDRKCHQIETETRHFQCVAKVPILSQIYEESRKRMVDASVGIMHSGLHTTREHTDKRRIYTNNIGDQSFRDTYYRRHIRHRTKTQNKCVGLGAESRKHNQVHRQLSPIKNVRSGTTSLIYDKQSHENHYAIEENGQATSRRKVEQVVYNSADNSTDNSIVTHSSDTLDIEGYKLAEDTETVGACASLSAIVTRGQDTDNFMMLKSYDRGEVKSSETLTKYYYKFLDSDTPSEGAKPTYPTASKVSSKRLLKTKLQQKRKDKMTNCSKTTLTHVIIEGSILFMRRRFGALKRRLGLKEKKINHTQNRRLKDSSPCFASSPSYKDVSISSDPPSLVARPYYTYSHQKIQCNNAKIKLQLWGKKNLDLDKCGTNVKARPQTKQVKQVKNIKKHLKEIYTLNSILCDNTAAKFRIPGKKCITACRCNVNDNVEMKISNNPELKIKIAPKSVKKKNTRKYTNSWLDQFLKSVKPNEKKVTVRLNNIKQQQSSNFTVIQLIDCLYKDIGLDLRSSRIEDSEKHSQIQHNNPFHQIIPVFVLHSFENKIPLDNEILLSKKDINNRYQSNQSRVRETKQKLSFEQKRKQSVRTEIVLHAMLNSKSYENHRIDTPSELSGYNKDSENQSEEMVRVVNYETLPSTKTDEAIIEDYKQLAVPQDSGCSIKIPVHSTFIRIVDYEIKSPIDSATTEYEEVLDGHECTSQSYANASRSESDSHVLEIYSKSCPNFLGNHDAYHNYIDDMCDVDSSCFKQSGMTAMVNQLKRIWHTMHRKGPLPESYIDSAPNVLEVFRNTKYPAASWAASLSDGVDEANLVRMKKTPIPSHEPGIFESHDDEDINKHDKNSARITRVNVIPFDGDGIPQKFSHFQKNLTLPLRNLHDRKAVNKQTKNISKMQLSGDIIKSTRYQTIAATSSMSIVVLKLLLSSINMANKRKKSTKSTSTQFTTLFQDSHYTQYSFLNNTKIQPNLQWQSTQKPSEKSFSITKATQFSMQNCRKSISKSSLQYRALLQTPTKQSITKVIKKLINHSKQCSCSYSYRSCSRSSKNIQKAMSKIRAKVLLRPYPKSKDSIRQPLCKIMDHFMDRPLCSLRSLGGQPCTLTPKCEKTQVKKTKNNSYKRDVICCFPAPSEYILPSTPTKSQIKVNSEDSYQESPKDDKLFTQTNLKDQYTEKYSKDTISIPMGMTWSCLQFPKEESQKCFWSHSKKINKKLNSIQLSKKSGTNSNDSCSSINDSCLGECPASFKDVLRLNNVQSFSSDEKFTENGNPSRDFSREQNITKSRPCDDRSLSKKCQTSVEGLRQNYSVKLSVKLLRKPHKQSVYSVNVPITPGAKGKNTKDLPVVQTEIDKPTKSPHEKTKSLEKPKTITLIKETAHTATALSPPRTLITSLPRTPKSAVERTKKKQSDSLKSLQPEQSNQDYSVMKCSETVTISSQKKTLIDDNDVKGQKETKPPAISSSDRDTNKPVKQEPSTSVAVKPRITNFNYTVDKSGLSTQCKLDTPALSPKSGELNDFFSQMSIHYQRSPCLDVNKFGKLDYNLDTDMIRFDDVKRKFICIVNTDKDCLDPKETAPTELLNSSITTEEKSLPVGTKNSSDESCSESPSEEPLGSSRDNTSSKQSDQSYNSEVTPQIEQQCPRSVDNSCNIDTNCVSINRRNKTLTSESSDNTTENLSKCLKPTFKSPQTCFESTDKSPISKKSSKCYSCQTDTKSKNGSNGEKSLLSSSTNCSTGSSSKKTSEKLTQSVQEKSSSKKSDSHITASDASKNARDDSKIGSPQSVCRMCNKHKRPKNRPEKEIKTLSDIIIKYKTEIDSNNKETFHGSDSTKSRNDFVSRCEISSSKNNSPKTSQKSLEGEDCRELQDEMKTKLKKCSKYTSSQKELKPKQNKETKSDSKMKSDDGVVSAINATDTCVIRTYSQNLNKQNTRMKEQMNFIKSSCSQPETESTFWEFCDKKLKPSFSSLKSTSPQPETTRTLKKPCATISKQTEITTKPKKSSSLRIALEQTQFDKYSDDKTESELLFARDNKEEYSGSKTADLKREDKIQRIVCTESQESVSRHMISRSKHIFPETSQKDQQKGARVKKNFTLRDDKGRVIVQRRDYSTDDEEEFEDKHKSDHDNDGAVEITFTLKICPDDKTEGETIDNVVKNKKSLIMCQTNNKNNVNQDDAKLYFEDVIKPNDVNVRVIIRNIVHQSNQTNTDTGNHFSDKTIKVLMKHCEDSRSSIPIKFKTNGISGYRNTALEDNSICILKSYSSESEVKSLIDKYQKVDILDQTNELNKFDDLRMKGKSASVPDIYKQRNAALEDSDNKRIQKDILPVEDLDNTTKQQRRQNVQNDKINLTNEKSVIENNPGSDFVLTNVELNSNESKGVQFVGLKSKELKNIDSMNNYYNMSTPPDCVINSSLVVLNEGLPEWRSDVSTWNMFRKKLKKCICASLVRKLDLQDVHCSCKKHRWATKKISCQISRDNLTFQTAKQPPLKNSHHNRTTAAFVTNRSGAHSKLKRNRHRRNKDKLEKHRFDYKSKTTEVLFETRHYRETGIYSQKKKTKTFGKSIDNPDILQSYAMKKAVLEIYKENKSTDEGNELIANLP